VHFIVSVTLLLLMTFFCYIVGIDLLFGFSLSSFMFFARL
jgi:hypothetical protein